MKVSPYPQRSDGWYRARLGLPTASNADKIITPAGKRSTQARRYLYQLAWERVGGEWDAGELAARVPHMMEGIEREDAAAAAFTAAHGLELLAIGFCLTDDGRFGASPDRVVMRAHECVEIKCPKAPTQIGYLIDGVKDAYVAQIAAHFLVGEWERVHFWSYHPDCPSYHTVYDYQSSLPYVRLLRDYLAEFCDALDEAEKKLRAMDWTWNRALSNWPEDEEPEAF